MSFADRTKNPPPPRDLCPIGLVLYQLDDDDRAEFKVMLADSDRWPHIGAYDPETGRDSIQNAIKDEGYGHVSDSAIRRHRTETCVCARA